MRNSSWCLNQIIDDAAYQSPKCASLHRCLGEKTLSQYVIFEFTPSSIFFSASKCASSFSFTLKGELRGCLHGGSKILEDEITFRLVYMQKFLSGWKWRMKARWRARTTNM